VLLVVCCFGLKGDLLSDLECTVAVMNIVCACLTAMQSSQTRDMTLYHRTRIEVWSSRFSHLGTRRVFAPVLCFGR
jgi:hypothetical protein